MNARHAPHQRTAEQLLSKGQSALVAIGLLLFVLQLAIAGPLAVLRMLVALVTAFYAVFVGMKILLWRMSSQGETPELQLPSVDDPSLPTYTILVPLRGEANVVEPLIEALLRLIYPVSKLQILLLLEEDDPETQDAVASLGLPSQFQALVVPNVGPRTKPKACNYGYNTDATGEQLVIFDAEDRPDPDQLLKAVAAFRAADSNVGCVQARLAFWNARHSWISSFYWSEYVVHFHSVLAGFARLGWIPPLGGTSNHFRGAALYNVSVSNGPWDFTDQDGNNVAMHGPWDPWNVTEDADLAFRLALAGWRITLFDSTTYEEAPNSARQARRQRSRWLQGYAQTGLVHTRQPFTSIRRVGLVRWLAFNLMMLGTPFSLLFNPVTWATTLLYVISRLCSLSVITAFIESLFPPPVYYTGMLVAVAGNAVLFYQKLLTPVRQQEHSEMADATGGEHEFSTYLRKQEYGLTVRLLLTPVWWGFTSLSAYRALRKLVQPARRSEWDKTTHGHDALTEEQLGQQKSKATPH